MKMKNLYYNKEGKEIALLEWAKLFEDKSYQIIKQDKLVNGLHVSTVWLGLDHSFDIIGHGKPLIFETMVFPKRSYGELDCERCSTLKQAIAIHNLMCWKWGLKKICKKKMNCH
jgi:hypothetical protein